MPYPPGVMLHVAAGMIALLAGFAALALPKGGAPHRGLGQAFMAAMLVMAGMGSAMGALADQPVNVLAGLFTCYLVGTAWMTMRRPAGQTGRIERVLAVAGAGIVMVALGFAVATAAAGNSPLGYGLAAGLLSLTIATDVKVARQGGVIGTSRLARHAWRMCLALFVAAGSFFLGQADEIPAAFRGPHLWLPPLAALAAIAYWMNRLRSPRRRAKPA